MSTMITKAKLRTKTGCLSCRKRRKKCDEVKPICTGCQRNCLECVWPSVDQFQDRRNLSKQRTPKSSRPSSAANSPFSDVSQDVQTPYGTSHHQCTCGHGSGSICSGSSVNYSSSSETSSYLTTSHRAPSPAQEAVSRASLTSRLTDWYSGFQSEAEYSIFSYFSNRFLPSLVHKEAHPRYHDFSYTISMALRFRPLMDISLATSLISMSTKEPQYAVKGMEYYLKAIHALREGMANGLYDGTEDYLLASVVALCLFEGRRPDSFPKIVGNHVLAVAQLFRIRANRKQLVDGSCEAVFNRICAESLLSHGSLMMICDKEFDPLVDSEIWEVLDRYIMNSPVGRAPSLINWPILGNAYPVIKMAVQASRLSKKAILDEEDLEMAMQLEIELESWEQFLSFKEREAAARAAAGELDGPNSRVSSSKLYVIASKVLLSISLRGESAASLAATGGHSPQHHYHDPNYDYYAVTQIHCDRGMAIVRDLDMRYLFGRSYVWPLAILGCVSKYSEDLVTVKEKLDIIRHGDEGGVQRWLCRRMEEVLSVLIMRRPDTDASRRLELLMRKDTLDDGTYMDRVLEL